MFARAIEDLGSVCLRIEWGRVARHAGRRDHEPLVHQRIAVDALRIVGDDVGLVDVPLPHHLGAFGVALAAQVRNAGWLDG